MVTKGTQENGKGRLNRAAPVNNSEKLMTEKQSVSRDNTQPRGMADMTDGQVRTYNYLGRLNNMPE